MQAAQSCPTLCGPMSYTVHGLLPARILEWGPFPSPGNLPNPGVEPRFPALQADSSPAEPPGKPKNTGVGSLSCSDRSRNGTRVSSLQVDSLPTEPSGKPQTVYIAPPCPFPVYGKFFVKLLVFRFFMIFWTRIEMQLLGVISTICPTLLFPDI